MICIAVGVFRTVGIGTAYSPRRALELLARLTAVLVRKRGDEISRTTNVAGCGIGSRSLVSGIP